MTKHIFLISVFILAFTTLFAQQRLTLVEHFTSASCYYCGVYNPALQELLDENTDQVVAIKYQSNFGYDPMYQHNPTESNARNSYYSVSGYPSTVFEGTQFNGHPASFNLGHIVDRSDDFSPFNINLIYDIADDETSVSATLKINALQDIDEGDIRAHIVVLEDHIHFNSAPGSNGETDFYNVMKKMLPNANGTVVDLPVAAGDEIVINESWDFANVYDVSEIRVIAFIQNNTTGEVLQAARGVVESQYTTDATLSYISTPAYSYCGETIEPQIGVRNTGNNTVTAFDIEYAINGGTAETYSWTGELGYNDITHITLPAATFEPEYENSISATVSLSGDENTDNNTYEKTFYQAEIIETSEIIFQIYPDNAYDYSWEIVDNAGTVVASGDGPYQAGTLSEEVIELENGCYEFIFYDMSTDGFTGVGYYLLLDSNENEFFTQLGGTFGAAQITPFEVYYQEQSAISSLSESIRLDVFPNPFSNRLSTGFFLQQAADVQMELYNTLGQKVYEEKYQLPGGEQLLEVNTGNWENGIYFVRLTIDGKSITRKVSLNR